MLKLLYAGRQGVSEPMAERSTLLASHAVYDEVPRGCAIAVEITAGVAT
jgi:hypothetical protein